ncbi:hypothetical protein SUBVAR_07124 [Subdoligranulum variabile DSM 15176]|uniref:Uncharacterized protein n=1 Tax=Subdoligranulum variabile DSM 15176 TaxID=411471 RepID=D1PRN9_9FIRM|nr:hypothetical protein SUBVAR_07124 [Subdoligranulum variabile DSM 15176]
MAAKFSGGVKTPPYSYRKTDAQGPGCRPQDVSHNFPVYLLGVSSVPSLQRRNKTFLLLLMSLRCAAKTYDKIHASGRSRGRMDKLCKFSTSWPS